MWGIVLRTRVCAAVCCKVWQCALPPLPPYFMSLLNFVLFCVQAQETCARALVIAGAATATESATASSATIRASKQPTFRPGEVPKSFAGASLAARRLVRFPTSPMPESMAALSNEVRLQGYRRTVVVLRCCSVCVLVWWTQL
jgi:hypothetical protein